VGRHQRWRRTAGRHRHLKWRPTERIGLTPPDEASICGSTATGSGSRPDRIGLTPPGGASICESAILTPPGGEPICESVIFDAASRGVNLRVDRGNEIAMIRGSCSLDGQIGVPTGMVINTSVAFPSSFFQRAVIKRGMIMMCVESNLLGMDLAIISIAAAAAVGGGAHK
jgi:hypothetical protein